MILFVRSQWHLLTALQRGMEVLDTGAPISVPVGDVTLGRVFNVLGENIDLDEKLDAGCTP